MNSMRNSLAEDRFKSNPEECLRWRLAKWGKWIDATSGAHVSPLQDIHCWMETRTHALGPTYN